MSRLGLYELDSIVVGDCLDVMAAMLENCVDTIITDPPYGLEFMGKEWDKLEPARNQQRWKGSERRLIGTGEGQGGDFGARMGEMPTYRPKRNPKCKRCGHYRFSGTPCKCETPKWDHRMNEHAHKMQDWHYAWATAALRVAKPGALLLAFGGSRTHHRLMCAIEDAGWEIRDCIMWVYGSGFPKSHDISKAIDKAAGAEREGGFIKAKQPAGSIGLGLNAQCARCGKWKLSPDPCRCGKGIPATAPAKLWDGWGTALKPAVEPIVLAMKPRDGTFANNALKWGVAGLWIDGGRIPTTELALEGGIKNPRPSEGIYGDFAGNIPRTKGSGASSVKGRWPANLILDGSEEVLAGFPSSNAVGYRKNECTVDQTRISMGKFKEGYIHGERGYPDNGSAARFFYCAKASRAERTANGTVENGHPTVKPLALMEYLCRLTKTPTGGVVFDPFAGSGTTAIAARAQGCHFFGCDISEEYVEIARQRLRAVQVRLL